MYETKISDKYTDLNNRIDDAFYAVEYVKEREKGITLEISDLKKTNLKQLGGLKMSKLTLDEAIKHCLEVAEQKEHDSAELIDILDELDVDACKECAADHRQLAEWLTELKELKALVAGYNPADIQTLEMLLAMMRNQNNNDTNLCELCDKEVELKEAKRLLKAAVEDMRYLESHTVDEEGSCLISDRGERILCSDCPFNNGGKVNEKCVWNYEAEALRLIGGSENG